MSGQASQTQKCQNGHDQPPGGSRFCIYCGVAVVVRQDAWPAPPQPPNKAGQQPVPHAGRPDPAQHSPQMPPPGHQMNQPPVQYHQTPQVGYAAPVRQQPICRTCGGSGHGLPEKTVMCSECRWLRPLVPGYQVDASAFAWAADAKAMAVLKSMKPLNMAAKAVSEKVGRRWIEVTFNGVRLGERQMPHIFGQAVRAARILGMSHMPDVYLSGERPWDMLTFGSDNDSFIVVGSAMAGNFQGVDMLYLLARELGHCKAGHALWKTVIRFFLGEQGPQRGVMAGGIFNVLLSPTALIGGPIEMPLLAWARQAEITADRAGLLTVGNEEIARRVLLSWSLKSSLLYRQLNIDSWIEQQSTDDGDMLRLSELTTTSTPYIGPRLKLLTQYAKSPELQGYLKIIGDTIRRTAPRQPAAAEKKLPNVIRFKCSACGRSMRIPMSAFGGGSDLPVRCPDAKCRTITRLEINAITSGQPSGQARERKQQENMNYGD